MQQRSRGWLRAAKHAILGAQHVAAKKMFESYFHRRYFWGGVFFTPQAIVFFIFLGGGLIQVVAGDYFLSTFCPIGRSFQFFRQNFLSAIVEKKR